MKKLFLVALFSVLFISCETKHYVLNSRFNPRPTSKFKFSIDNRKSKVDCNSVIDTNAIYLTTYYRRMKSGVTGIYYRFMPNGVVYEVVVYGGSIEKAVKDTVMGNYGKYKIISPNKIKMEFLVELKDTGMDRPVVMKRIQKAKVRGDNIYLNPNFYSKTKGVYEEIGKAGKSAGSAAGYLYVFAAPVLITDMIIPNRKVCFYRVNFSNLEYYLVNH